MNWIRQIIATLNTYQPKQQPGDWAAMEELINQTPQLQPKKGLYLKNGGLLGGALLLVALIGFALFPASKSSESKYNPRSHTPNTKTAPNVSSNTDFSATTTSQFNSNALQNTTTTAVKIPTTKANNTAHLTTSEKNLPNSKAAITKENTPSAEKQSIGLHANKTAPKRFFNEKAVQLASKHLFSIGRTEQLPLAEGTSLIQHFTSQNHSRKKQKMPLPNYLKYAMGIGTSVPSAQHIPFTHEAIAGWTLGKFSIEVGLGQSRFTEELKTTTPYSYQGEIGFEEVNVDSTWQIIYIYQGQWQYDTTTSRTTELFSVEGEAAGKSKSAVIQSFHVPIRVGYRDGYKNWRYGLSLGGQYTQKQVINNNLESGTTTQSTHFWQPQFIPHIGYALSPNIELNLEMDIRPSEQSTQPAWMRISLWYQL